MLCTQADVEKRLQWDITAEPDSVVTSLIAAAQALIEAEVGRTLESTTREEALDSGPRNLFLEFWPVTAVTSVVEDGTALDPDEFTFYEGGRLIRTDGAGYQTEWLTAKPQAIEVEYTGGFVAGTHDAELEHLKSLCTEIVARAFRQGAANAALPAGAGLAGVSSVSLAGSDSVSFSTPGGESIELGGGLSRFVLLLDEERRQLVPYKPVPIV